MSYRRTSVDDGAWIIGLGWLVLVLIGAVGWIWNIVKIVQHIADPISAMFIARCVGVFAAPLGAVLGFL